jgi:hypothetical protein
MRAITKITCALLLTGGLAAPAWAAPGDAGSGPTTGATATNDAGSGPTKGANAGQTTAGQDMNNGQSSMNGQTGMNGQNDMTAGPGGMEISKKLRSDLTNAGFTDIHIMPQSFMVRAKDAQGNPVMMVINPDSLTAITEEVEHTNAASNANHGTTTNNNNAAGATPGPSSTGGSQPVTPGGAAKP